jgi:Protein of unknown function (DUF998)
LSDRQASRLAALSAPIFVVIVVVLTVHEWSFLHHLGWRVWGSSNVPWPSSTALGSWGWLQIVNFLQLGLAVLYLSERFTKLLPARRARTLARWTLRLAGLALLALCFKTDPSGTVKTWHGGIHAIAFVVLVLATLVAMFAVARAGTQPARRASMFAAAAVILFTAVSIAWSGSGAVFGTLALLTILGWVELLALLVARDSRGPDPAGECG